MNDNYILYVEPIKRLYFTAVNQRQPLSLDKFKSIFLRWQDIDHTSSKLEYNLQQRIAEKIGQMLLAKGYLPISTTNITIALDRKFTSILSSYSYLIPEIVKVLLQHFAHALGESAFDVESYEIDANGNHRHFYTGFNRYVLNYRNNTNQIQNVKLDWPTAFTPEQVFSIKHDTQGNVIQALHKNIQNIEYHPVSQRTTCIKLTDGRIVRFYYDAQGERVLKKVLTADGQVSDKTYYLRDEQGQVLVDLHTKYLPVPQQIVTAYLYGPRGILGFIRNDAFYSVTTDHAGSVRLVIKAGQVVAAYDYLPYGQLMRSYGNDPQAHIMYRYTGQEWDEETGLYNYHARLYDPSIGRFYQPDPKSQYFSPYKYAGNSPISLVDPDGEEAITFIMMGIGALIGAYLGGAVANNRWNPADWDFKSSDTWLGVVGGALAGGLLPVGFGATAQVIGVGPTIVLGLGGSYLTTSAANQNWNFLAWQWDRPHTWNAVFQGFSTGSGVVGGIKVVHNYASKTFSKAFSKKLFLTTSYSAGAALTYYAGVKANEGNFAFWQWDWRNPATWSALLDGFDSGMGWPQGFREITLGLSKFAKNPKKLGNLLNNISTSKKQALKSILQNPHHPLYKVVASGVMVYFMGSSANSELDITRWNLATFSTYEGILNGVFFGKDISVTLGLARSAKIKTRSLNAQISVSKMNHFPEVFHDLLDNIRIFRTNVEYKRLMEQSFSQDTIWRLQLEHLNNKPASLMKDVENFFKHGLEKWKKGESQPPEALQQLIRKQVDQHIKSSSKKLIELQGDAAQKQREIFPDQEAEFLSCSKAARRKKRGALKFLRACAVENPPLVKNEITKAGVDIFLEDPIQFIKQYPITTRSLDGAVKKKISLKNGEIYNFILTPNMDGGSYGGGYRLGPPQDGSTSVNIKGYWLSTSKKGEIDDPGAIIKNIDPGDVRFIFTSELNGCTIYVKYDEITKQMEVFHYNRPALEVIYINDHKGSKIDKNKNNYLSSRRNNIEELPNGATFVNRKGELIIPKDGVIVIDQKLYYKVNDKEPKIKIETINGVGIDTIIGNNQKKLHNEQILAKKYPIVVKWEEYSKLPENYLLLLDYKMHPFVSVTPFLFRDNDGKWNFISQKIIYTKDMTDKRFAKNFELDLNGFYQVPIPIPNPVSTSLSEGPSRSNLRRKKSLNHKIYSITKLNAANSKEISNTKYLKESLLYNNTIPSINQVSSFDEEIMKEPCIHIVPDMVSSGSSLVKFWPINLIKRASTAIASFLPTHWVLTAISSGKSQPESLIKQESSFNNTETSSTTLDNQWPNNIDINGNLLWGVLLTRKWSGYRPTALKADPEISMELNLWATTLVDEFMNALLKHALACGIRPIVSNILKDSKLYLKVIHSTHRKLEAGLTKDIPQLLYNQIVKPHINQIASASTQVQANRLLVRIAKDIPKIQQQILQQEQEWLSRKQYLAGITVSQPFNNAKRADINILAQAKSSSRANLLNFLSTKS